jgi:hypothetical protein
VQLVGFIITIYHDAQSSECQNSLVSIVIRIQAGCLRGNRFLLLPSIQTRSRAHFALTHWVLEAVFSAAEQQGRSADRLHPSSAKVKSEWRYTPVPSHISV